MFLEKSTFSFCIIEQSAHWRYYDMVQRTIGMQSIVALIWKSIFREGGWGRTTALFVFAALVGLSSYANVVLSPKHRTADSSGGLRVIVGDGAEQAGAEKQEEYVMWSNEEAFFNECRAHFLHNVTWGKPLNQFVEKVEAKKLAAAWSPSVKVIPTLAFYDPSNITDFTYEAMMRLPQPYIIKPAHSWGGIAGVKDDEYHCFRGCFKIRDFITESVTLNEYSAHLAQEQMQTDLQRDHSVAHGEMQYYNVPPRIIVEEQLDMEHIRDVTYWYTADGQPIFVSMECNEEHGRNIYNTDFVQLPVRLSKPPCLGVDVKKPKTWDLMHKIATELGRHLKGYNVRIDLYASEEEVFFSEFTFTTAGCVDDVNYHPRVADGLLYAVAHGEVPASIATADFVKRTVENKSWVLLLPEEVKDGRSVGETRAFPSPVDLCESDEIRQTLRDACYEAAREAEVSPLRCFLLEPSSIRSVGVSTYHLNDQHLNNLECSFALSAHK